MTQAMAQRVDDRLARTIDRPEKGNRVIFDDLVRGFGLRVTAGGARAFILNYRRRADGLERRHTIGQYPDWSVAAARDEARRLKRAIDGGADPVGERRDARDAATIADLCDKFLAEYLPTRRPLTARDYRRHIAMYIRPLLGRHGVESLCFEDVARFHWKISENSPVAANRVLQLLSRMMTLAERWHMRTRTNPCSGVERNTEHGRRRYLSSAELARLVAALSASKNRDGVDAIRLLLLTGARRTELLSARWADFDLDTGIWTKPGATTKQQTVHIVPLSVDALAILKARPRASEFVFPAENGHRRDISSFWESICETAEIRGLRVHDLRHSFASTLASTGVSLPTIGALLGHTQPGTTARYAHLFDDALRAATEKVGAIIAGRDR
jgi:integrase